MKIQYAKEVGLLFVDGVAIAKEMLEHLNTIINYDPQFESSVQIIDTVNNTRVLIGKERLIDINVYIAMNNITLASKNYFNLL